MSGTEKKHGKDWGRVVVLARDEGAKSSAPAPVEDFTCISRGPGCAARCTYAGLRGLCGLYIEWDRRWSQRMRGVA